jgi:PAS domain-containing protein
MTDEAIRLIEIAAAAAVTLGAKSGVDFFKKKRDSERVDFKTLLIELKSEIDTLKNERKEVSELNSILQKRVFELELIVKDLRNKIVLLGSAHDSSPLPSWLKDTDGTMLSLNQAYASAFLEPNGIKIEDYIGRSDFAVWPKDIAEEYQKNDLQVLKTRKDFIGEENIYINGKATKWKIIKWVRYVGRLPIGIAGKAVPVNFEILKELRTKWRG